MQRGIIEHGLSLGKVPIIDLELAIFQMFEMQILHAYFCQVEVRAWLSV